MFSPVREMFAALSLISLLLCHPFVVIVTFYLNTIKRIIYWTYGNCLRVELQDDIFTLLF